MTAEALEREIVDAVGRRLGELGVPGLVSSAGYDVRGQQPLVTTGQWTERWPAGEVAVTGQLWRAAIQAALDAHDHVHLPALDQPYYLDGPLVLRSGHCLTADPAAEIRLRPGTNTCLVRNAHLVPGQAGPVTLGEAPDEHLVVAGGRWTALSTSRGESNGNDRGQADGANSCPGAHGVFLFHNVRGLTVQHAVIAESRAFGVHLGNVEGFLIDDVRFVGHQRDGVHVNGPARYGLIRGIRGATGDDIVALNAWEWYQYTISFGPIDHVVIEDLEPDASYPMVRLLPGVKRYPSGIGVPPMSGRGSKPSDIGGTPMPRPLQPCPVRRVVLRRARGLTTVKLYDQPNLETRQPRDESAAVGEASDIVLRDIDFRTADGLPPVQVMANADGLWLDRIRLTGGGELVYVGPQSQTWQSNPADPATWLEIFDPDRECTVRGLHLSRITDAQGRPLDPAGLVRVVQLQPNPDYPRTTPRGGTGRGHLVP